MAKTKANESKIGKTKERIATFARALVSMFGDDNADVDAELIAHLSQTINGICMHV